MACEPRLEGWRVNGGWIDRVNARVSRGGIKNACRRARDSILSDRDKRSFFARYFCVWLADVRVIVGVSKHRAGLESIFRDE